MTLLSISSKSRYIQDFVHCCCVHLGIDNLPDSEIIIKFQKHLYDGAYGHCWGDTEHAEVHIARYHGDQRLSKAEMLSTLAHELVHAKQYLRGELVDLDDEVGFWKGKEFDSSLDELHLPWEVEAYKLEMEIYELYERARST